ncbi:MAG: ATP-binding cassette domain-containing protein [Clostridium sp.]|uniref:ABC transporter ATP-binding protein n=1 Tax=Clostridium sp. TaxID=1506 RepID=UPI002FCB2B82
MSYIIQTINLNKQYKNTFVIKDLNLNIKKGEIHGFLGKNGAGKTTTLKMLLGLTKPTSGKILINGDPYSKNTSTKHIGSVIEYPSFYPNLTCYENLNIHRLMMGIANENYIYDVLKIVNLNSKEILNKKVKHFSLGMKQRLGIARALLHKPNILILDEPTNGLDPLGIKDLRNILLDLSRNSNISILLSSHILSEVSELADTISIIDNGYLVDVLNEDKLLKLQKSYIRINTNDLNKCSIFLEKSKSIQNYSITNNNEIRIFDEIIDTALLNKELIENSISIKEINIVNQSLEEYFLNLVGGQTNA